MHVDVYGQGVSAERATAITDESIERTRDLLMLKLEKGGVPYRKIAKMLGTSAPTVCRRLKRMPKHVRSHYEKHPLVGLG